MDTQLKYSHQPHPTLLSHTCPCQHHLFIQCNGTGLFVMRSTFPSSTSTPFAEIWWPKKWISEQKSFDFFGFKYNLWSRRALLWHSWCVLPWCRTILQCHPCIHDRFILSMGREHWSLIIDVLLVRSLSPLAWQPIHIAPTVCWLLWVLHHPGASLSERNCLSCPAWWRLFLGQGRPIFHWPKGWENCQSLCYCLVAGSHSPIMVGHLGWLLVWWMRCILWVLRTVSSRQHQDVDGAGCAMHLSIFVGMDSFVTLCSGLGLLIVFWQLVLWGALISVEGVQISGRTDFIISIHVLQALLQRTVTWCDLLMLQEHLARMFLVWALLVWFVSPLDNMREMSLLQGSSVRHNHKQLYSCTGKGGQVLWACTSLGLSQHVMWVNRTDCLERLDQLWCSVWACLSGLWSLMQR